MKPCEICSNGTGIGTGWIIAYSPDGREGEACSRCAGRGVEPSTPAERERWERLIRNERLVSAVQPAPVQREAGR